MIFVREQIAQIYHLLWLLNEAQNGTLFEQVKRSAALTPLRNGNSSSLKRLGRVGHYIF